MQSIVFQSYIFATRKCASYTESYPCYTKIQSVIIRNQLLPTTMGLIHVGSDGRLMRNTTRCTLHQPSSASPKATMNSAILSSSIYYLCVNTLSTYTFSLGCVFISMHTSKKSNRPVPYSSHTPPPAFI